MAFSRLRASVGQFVRCVASTSVPASCIAIDGVAGARSAAGDAYSHWTAGACAGFAIAASAGTVLSDDAYSWYDSAKRSSFRAF
jgi:hypothetical protein